MRQCVILAGGRGTRLGPLTDHTPKPLVAVAGRPFLVWLVERAARLGFAEVLCLSGYLGGQIEAALGTGEPLGVSVRHLQEAAPAGTAGALALAADALDEEFLLLNGDTLFAFDWRDLFAFPLPGVGALALRPVDDAGRYGRVELDAGRITAFREKSAEDGPGLINGGVYRLSRGLLAHIPQGFSSLEQDVFPGLAAAGRLGGLVREAPFIDIGVPASLALAQTFVPDALAASDLATPARVAGGGLGA